MTRHMNRNTDGQKNRDSFVHPQKDLQEDISIKRFINHKIFKNIFTPLGVVILFGKFE